MAEAIFDKEGNLVNLDELTREEVAVAYQEKNRAVFNRVTEEETKRKQFEAEKARLEADLAEVRKASAPVPTPAPLTPTAPKPEVDVTELRLIAKGLSDEEITEAKDIARGKNITLVEALETKAFKLFQADLKEEKRREDAKLSASKGSGTFQESSDIKPAMTKEEHTAAWKKALGK